MKKIILILTLSALSFSCAQNPSRAVAAETCNKQEWTDSEAYFKNYELCKGY